MNLTHQDNGLGTRVLCGISKDANSEQRFGVSFAKDPKLVNCQKCKDKATAQRLARTLADTVCRMINVRAPRLKMENPYKSQYVLEELITILQERV